MPARPLLITVWTTCIHAQAALGPTGRAQDSTSEKPRVSFFSAAGFYGEERAGFYGEEG